MAYNKAKAEKEWLRWKEVEEKKLRELGVDEEYRQYVEMFHAFLAMSKGQHLKGTICSYGSTLVFSFSFDLKDVSVQRGFFRKIAADGIEVELDTNGVTAD